MSRAGLLSILLFFTACIGLTTAAPISERISGVVERHDYNNDVVARYFDILDRDFDIPSYSKRDYLLNTLDIRESDDDHYFQREYSSLSMLQERDFDEVELLYAKRDILRRRSIFDRIRNAFRNAGSAIKNGFHKVQTSFQRAGGAMRNGFQKVGQHFKAVGNKMRSGFQRIGQGFKTAGRAMRSGFQKIGQGFKTAGRVMKSGFQKAGTYLKKSGAMIGKFALKLVAAGATVAAKVVGFVPGIGTAASRILKGIAMGANEGSKQIHADLPGNLQKASEGMDYVISPMSSLGKLAGGDKAKKAFEVMENIF